MRRTKDDDELRLTRKTNSEPQEHRNTGKHSFTLIHQSEARNELISKSTRCTAKKNIYCVKEHKFVCFERERRQERMEDTKMKQKVVFGWNKPLNYKALVIFIKVYLAFYLFRFN